MHTTLIATHVLAERADATWTIIDCRFDLQNEGLGYEQYRAAHIPRAVYANLTHDLSGEKTGRNGRHPLPTIGQMTATFSRLGIDRTTQVVVYDHETGMFAARLWWMLRYLGHDAVAVLDGGWTKWAREGRPTTSGDDARPAATFVAVPQSVMLVSVGEVAAAGPGTRLIDARGAERFEGQSEPLDAKAGHIPGAINYHYARNLDDGGTLHSPDRLRQRFADALEGTAPRDVVMYCGSGVSACLNLLALEHAGLSGAKLYPGSWSEWSADPARTIETGPTRRPGPGR